MSKIYRLRDRFAMKYYGKRFYEYQREPSNAIIRAVLESTGEDIFIEISRQAGKTDMLVITLDFLQCFIKDIIGEFHLPFGQRGFHIVIGAPQKE